MDKNIKEMVEYPKEGILSKVISNENYNITLFCMAKGTEISEHTSTKAGIVYVIEGDGIFNLAGKEIKMSPETLITMDSNQKHSIKAREETSFLLILK